LLAAGNRDRSCLPGGNEVLERPLQFIPGKILGRGIVNTEEVDMVRPEPPQARFDRTLHELRGQREAAIGLKPAPAHQLPQLRGRFHHPPCKRHEMIDQRARLRWCQTDLGGYLYPIPSALQEIRGDDLGLSPTIGGREVEPGHSTLESLFERDDPLLPSDTRSEGSTSESKAGSLEASSAEPDSPHCRITRITNTLLRCATFPSVQPLFPPVLNEGT